MREKFSNKSEFISAKENMYFSLICPIVQNKKKRLKYSATTQITHDWGTYLSESSSYYYLMATGGWNPWKKIRVVVLLLLFFKVALLEFFFPNVQKSPLWNQYYRFSYYMIDMENCWCFTVGDLLNGNECF